MKAIVIEGKTLAQRDVADPVPGHSEILVRVEASGLNRADLVQLRGHYPAPPGAPRDIPGLEYAGQVIACGDAVTRLRPGDRVMGIVGGGAFAERVVVHEREAILIPDGLDAEQAAAIPEAFITAYDAMVLQGGLRSGETVLINAVASGVGTAAVQIAHALGARAIGTARSEDKVHRVQAEFGLELGIACPEGPSFAPRCLEATGDRGVELVLELVGGSYVPESLRSLTLRGRLVLVGLLAGAKAELDLGHLLRRRLTVVGTVLRSRPLEEKILVARAVETHLVPLFGAGRLRPVIDRVYPFDQITDAFAYLGANASFGKVVLRW